MDSRQPELRIVKYDADGNMIDPFPNAPYIPKPPLSSLRRAGPIPPDQAEPEGPSADIAPAPAPSAPQKAGRTEDLRLKPPLSKGGSTAPAVSSGPAPKAKPSKRTRIKP